MHKKINFQNLKILAMLMVCHMILSIKACRVS